MIHISVETKKGFFQGSSFQKFWNPAIVDSGPVRGLKAICFEGATSFVRHKKSLYSKAFGKHPQKSINTSTAFQA
jgi:hypothetical protein